MTITRFETKILWRNWFFRIVAIAGLFFTTIFSIAVFSQVSNSQWYFISNSWIQPYGVMTIINIPQVAAVLFLATGLIKKDKKIDTNEVFFVRPISNLDYVFGKALALFSMFFILNLVLLIIPVIINLTNPASTFNGMAWIMYPLVTSVPSIVFTAGISFLLVTLLKNQPITIVLLIGLTALQLIYYYEEFSNILDFSAFRISMLASEMAGFVNIDFALKQRLFYFVTGITALFLTAFFLDRLSSHKRTKALTGIIGVVLLAVCSWMMLQLWMTRNDEIEIRKEMVEMNDQWINEPNVTVLSNAIELKHVGDEIIASSEMLVLNKTENDLSRIFFTLNPGLSVNEVLVDGQPSPHNQTLQIVSIDGVNLAPNENTKVRISYAGSIDESAAHLEVDRERYEEPNEYFMLSLQKKHVFLKDDYLLFTKDILWYPDTQVGYSQKAPQRGQSNFIDFDLTVKTKNGLVAISQGESIVENNVYRFQPEYPLPQISLVVGQYQRKELVIDSTAYVLYHHPKHTFIEEQLNLLSDTISYLVPDLVNEYEDNQKLDYPFKRLMFVEAPLQFYAYSKIFEGYQAYVQPEMVFWPEEGGDIYNFDFPRKMRDMNYQARRSNQVLSEKEKQANIFNDLIRNLYTKQSGSNYYVNGNSSDNADYAIFPNYYSFNSGIISEDWPLFDRSIAIYLRNDQQYQIDYSRSANGISFDEVCNRLMAETSIEEIVTTEGFDKSQKSVALKSQQLFAYLGQVVGESNLKSFLYSWINQHQNQLTSYQQLRRELALAFKVDVDSIIQKVYFDKAQPAFEILNLKNFEIIDGDRTRYQVILEIRNSGNNDGVIDVRFNVGNSNNSGTVTSGISDAPGGLAAINQGQIKRLGFVLDVVPTRISINTMISQNIPSVIETSPGKMSKSTAKLFDGEQVIQTVPPVLVSETIVDNEDDGFSTFSPIKPTYLRAYLDAQETEEQEYYGSWSRSYAKWRATTGSDFYGKIIRSAHFTQSGSGEKQATWSPELDEDAVYDIYTYLRGPNQNEYTGNNPSRQFVYHYIINHGDGEDQVNFTLANAEPGWNYLGTYFFEKSGGSISLTDECDFRVVYADAIKWVKQ